MLHEKTTFAISSGKNISRKKNTKHNIINFTFERNARVFFFLRFVVYIVCEGWWSCSLFIVLCCFVNNIMICTVPTAHLDIETLEQPPKNVDGDTELVAGIERATTKPTVLLRKMYKFVWTCFPYSFYCYLLCLGTANYISVLFYAVSLRLSNIVRTHTHTIRGTINAHFKHRLCVDMLP